MENTIKTLAQFRASKVAINAKNIEDLLGFEIEHKKAILYAGNYYIEIDEDGNYCLSFEVSSYQTRNLKLLEKVFWKEFVQYSLLTVSELDHEEEARRLAKQDKYILNRNFKLWLYSDNVLKVSPKRYQTQCSQYSTTFTKKELKAYYIREYDSK